MKLAVGFLCLLIIVGCRGAFQPPPNDYQIWMKSGAVELDVKKALLECGAGNPSGAFTGLSHNDVALVHICMRHGGYNKKVPPARDDKHICSMHPSLPACQPGASIPKPSVERRLNSEYCKRKRDYDYCVKTAAHPPGCIYNDYKNPPPECLP